MNNRKVLGALIATTFAVTTAGLNSQAYAADASLMVPPTPGASEAVATATAHDTTGKDPVNVANAIASKANGPKPASTGKNEAASDKKPKKVAKTAATKKSETAGTTKPEKVTKVAAATKAVAQKPAAAVKNAQAPVAPAANKPATLASKANGTPANGAPANGAVANNQNDPQDVPDPNQWTDPDYVGTVTLVGERTKVPGKTEDVKKIYVSKDEKLGAPKYGNDVLNPIGVHFVGWSDQAADSNGDLAASAKLFSPDDLLGTVFKNGIPKDAKIYGIYRKLYDKQVSFEGQIDTHPGQTDTSSKTFANGTDKLGAPEVTNETLVPTGKKFLGWSDKKPNADGSLAADAKLFSDNDTIDSAFPEGMPDGAKLYAVYQKLYNKTVQLEKLQTETAGEVTSGTKTYANGTDKLGEPEVTNKKLIPLGRKFLGWSFTPNAVKTVR